MRFSEEIISETNSFGIMDKEQNPEKDSSIGSMTLCFFMQNQIPLN